MEYYPHSLLIYDNTVYISGLDFYINYCVQQPEKASSKTTSLILKEKYNAVIRKEYIDSDIIKVYLDFETEEDKLAFLIEWS